MASINLSEISGLIKEQIKAYKEDITTENVGHVVQVGDGIALVHGLDKAMASELLVFPNDVYGMVQNLEENCVGVILLGECDKVKEGDLVKSTGRILEIPVGEDFIGRVMNPLGQPIDGLGVIKENGKRPIEQKATGVMDRQSVNQPLQTGIKVLDALVPIGRGQRELIIGDRQTGKTSIVVDTILNQKDQDVICIYVAIGQKESTVSNVYETLKDNDAMK
jgi:F-type H+-transporting ATPase subunit alpha